MKKNIKLYFDSYEVKFGDGFYPMITRDSSCDSEINIDFELYDDELTQLSGPFINGYDGNTYNEIIRLIICI